MSYIIQPPVSIDPVAVCTIERTTALSNANNTILTVPFNSEILDNLDMYDGGVDATSIIIPAGYNYARCFAYVGWSNGIVAGVRRGEIMLNGASTINYARHYHGGFNPAVTGHTGKSFSCGVINVAGGDAISLQTYQNSGVAQNLNGLWLSVEAWK